MIFLYLAHVYQLCFTEGRMLLYYEQTETFYALERVVGFAELNKAPIADELDEALTARGHLEDVVIGPLSTVMWKRLQD